MSEVLAPERLHTVAHIHSRYAEQLQPLDQIRTGIEGDPAAVFRSAEAVLTGTVLDVTRHGNGEITFQAEMSNGEIRRYSNYDKDPAKTWEIDPKYAQTFGQDLARPREAPAGPAGPGGGGGGERRRHDPPRTRRPRRRAACGTPTRRASAGDSRSAMDDHVSCLEAQLSARTMNTSSFAGPWPRRCGRSVAI